MLDVKSIRKLLMTAVVMALATMPVAAESPAQGCWMTEQHYNLSCNDGSLMRVCETPAGDCTVDCGKGAVGGATC